MINIIKAEIYKYIHRPYFHVITLVVSSIILLSEFLFLSNIKSRVFVISEVCPMGMNFTLVLIILFSLVFSEEYKFNSLKNLIASNISKKEIYLGKVLVQILIILFMGIIILGVFLGGFFLLKPEDGYSNDMLIRLVIKIAASLPILLAGLALVNLLIIAIKKEGIAISIYITFLLLSSEVIKLISRTIWDKLIIINKYFFQTQILILFDVNATNSEIVQAALIGSISMIIFVIFAGLLFKRDEVK